MISSLAFAEAAAGKEFATPMSTEPGKKEPGARG
jgi:hypothetical protein